MIVENLKVLKIDYSLSITSLPSLNELLIAKSLFTNNSSFVKSNKLSFLI